MTPFARFAPARLALAVGLALAATVVPVAQSRAASPAVVLTIDPSARHPISPYVYGLNRASPTAGPVAYAGLERAGGNRWTAYNWENNASNAGSDYNYQNDTYLGEGAPAEPVVRFLAADQALGIASIVTVPMQGLVAADTNGPVPTDHPPDAKRFKEVVYQKSTLSTDKFTTSPSVTDPFVYVDEFVWTLDKKLAGAGIFSKSPKRAPVYVELDNEPELWNSTHLEIQGPNRVKSDLYIEHTLRLARALKAQFPDMVIFGPANYGFYGLYSWQGEFSATPGGRDWFVDRYARAVHAASGAAQRPLVDVYDVHWYPEATDAQGHRVTQLPGPLLSDEQVQAIVQNPRSYWDTSYTERSWVSQSLGGPVNLLGRLAEKVEAGNPGMKLAVTEYNPGGGKHIAGAIAEADTVGIFGARGVFAACLWPLGGEEPYIAAGLRAFRNFDGAGGNFGDISLGARSSNVEAVSVYASADSSRPGRQVVVAINRSAAAREASIVGLKAGASAQMYRLTHASGLRGGAIVPEPVVGKVAVQADLKVVLPALSVTTLEIQER